MADRLLGGRYRLHDELGSGGMAVVWRGHDEVLDRPVAVKLLAEHHSLDPRSRQRIRDEARSAAALSHPHVAQVYDFGESVEDGFPVPYVVMELISGCTLEQRIALGPVSPAEAFRICAEVAAGLAAAHDHGLVHRDIKPANVMVTAAGVKVVDFGIAAAVRPGGRRWLDAELLGTPAYIAPERVTDDSVEPASDVYAVGVLLYRLLAGQPPWSAETATQMLTAHVYVEPAPLPALPGIPRDVLDICRRCLAKDPAERPTATELAAVLQTAASAAAGPDSPAAGSAVGAWSRAGRRGRRRALLATAGAAIGVAAALVLSGTVGSDGWQQGRAAPGGTDPSERVSQSSPIASAGTDVPDEGSPQQPPPAGARPPAGDDTEQSTTTAPVGAGEPSAPDAEPSSAPAPTTAAPAPSAQQRTLGSEGGTVLATCSPADVAELLSWEPAQTYHLDAVRPGPARTVGAIFRKGNQYVRMRITCEAGVPSAVVDYRN
nr:serine/threonine-protein kinase [Micromonospora sp. DSM 115978]